ncbi:2-dehydropantoate 2-reductase family protein [Xylona heveae TC161]|uniref:2-dehydropantoate 2-reductase n=1 Tax=Xylona heveae (strain CBS 132557 / TC161) TaxID=1328760 RepID=A0A164ZGX6_XYLHT|nr:2-dehydropantoate 2-reductase family protein [Xylona heveae TC161]KZF19091.1 2-dehydropantoate 2-reductase family protein [Xylona heveae TC161]
MAEKASVLLIGSGGVGTIAAVNLERGGLASVTAVLRSNYNIVKESGFDIQSCDHGHLEGWRPSKIINRIPDVAKENLRPFDYIICTTKNLPDIPPTVTDLIRPAVTPGHTAVVLIQNGLNIEKPLLAAFPQNVILSGVSLIGSKEPTPAKILHEFEDQLLVGAFNNPQLDSEHQQSVARKFVEIYSAGGKTKCEYQAKVGWYRWRKLVYNACLNPICAITGLDTGRIRLADGAIAGLLYPAMEEIRAAAKAAGHVLPDDIAHQMLTIEPVELYLSPSMLVDSRKGNFIEVETILGEPLREGRALGVPMPTLSVLYELGRAIQWGRKESRGMVSIPPKQVPGDV